MMEDVIGTIFFSYYYFHKTVIDNNTVYTR